MIKKLSIIILAIILLLPNVSFAAKTITNTGVQSGSFDGTGDYLSVPDSADWDFGTGNFTIDFWVRFNALSEIQAFIAQWQDTSNLYYFRWHTNNVINFGAGGIASYWYAWNWTPSTGTWYHLALVRNEANVSVYVDGTALTLNGGSTPIDNFGNFNAPLWIGYGADGSPSYFPFNGWLDEIRISKGIARWTANFTPPAEPYAADANTNLLLHADGTNGSTTFTDSETTPKTVTANGNAAISTAQGKFGGVFTTSAQTKFGNVAAFNGSNDYLSLADSADWDFSSNPFTIDFWVRWPVDPGTGIQNFVGQYDNTDNRSNLVLNNNQLQWMVVSGAVDALAFNAAFNPVVDTWYHIALVRVNTDNAATGWRIFVDGVSQTLTKIGGSWDAAMLNLASSMYLGVRGSLSLYLNGYLDELRVSKGIARWTANFTPESSAYTCADSYTKLLVHADGTDGSTTFTDDDSACISNLMRIIWWW